MSCTLCKNKTNGNEISSEERLGLFPATERLLPGTQVETPGRPELCRQHVGVPLPSVCMNTHIVLKRGHTGSPAAHPRTAQTRCPGAAVSKRSRKQLSAPVTAVSPLPWLFPPCVTRAPHLCPSLCDRGTPCAPPLCDTGTPCASPPCDVGTLYASPPCDWGTLSVSLPV